MTGHVDRDQVADSEVGIDLALGIVDYLGQYRFIYMLRNPLTRIESQLRHGLFAGWGKSLDAGIPDDAVYYSSYAMQRLFQL